MTKLIDENEYWTKNYMHDLVRKTHKHIQVAFHVGLMNKKQDHFVGTKSCKKPPHQNRVIVFWSISLLYINCPPSILKHWTGHFFALRLRLINRRFGKGIDFGLATQATHFVWVLVCGHKRFIHLQM